MEKQQVDAHYEQAIKDVAAATEWDEFGLRDTCDHASPLDGYSLMAKYAVEQRATVLKQEQRIAELERERDTLKARVEELERALMSTSLHTLQAKIAVDSKIGWRKSRTALFQWIRDGEFWFMVEVWFEKEKPQMQIRSSAHDLEEAAVIAQAVHMAIDWAQQEIATGGNKEVHS